MTWEFGVGIAVGVLIWWALTKLMRAAAYGGSKVGSNARQRWLAKMDYESLLRTRKQIDMEIASRQPGPNQKEPETEVIHGTAK